MTTTDRELLDAAVLEYADARANAFVMAGARRNGKATTHAAMVAAWDNYQSVSQPYIALAEACRAVAASVTAQAFDAAMNGYDWAVDALPSLEGE